MAEENDFSPVLVFIPVGAEVRNFLKTRNYSYKNFVEAVRRENQSRRLVVIDIMEKEFDYYKFYLHRLKGHCSGYGNRIIANAVYSGIKSLMQGK